MAQLTIPGPYRRRGPAHPAQQLYRAQGSVSPTTRPDLHHTAVAANPLFGRPSYAAVKPQGVLGPPLAGNYKGGTINQPARQLGTGHTARRATHPGTQATLPAYMPEQTGYQPQGLDYQPPLRTDFLKRIPATLHGPGMWVDGRNLIGSYQPHDFTAGVGDQRFNHQFRSAPNWQVMSFPPDYRILLQRQQVMRYQINSQTRLARPLRQTDYFLGYVTQPSIAAQIGGNTLGVMGSQ